ncbi:uncharacterized protein METZ01_LOCUS201974 [marine metagenome]|uniref:Uncharacterized protein n=1 Tax=marine metagenome TaxID=408172 RepID=A0A382EEM5_9ZZZZ
MDSLRDAKQEYSLGSDYPDHYLPPEKELPSGSSRWGKSFIVGTKVIHFGRMGED